MRQKKKSFEESIGRLDEIVAALENGDTGLEGSLSLFAEGATLLCDCQKMLDDAELTIEKLLPGEPRGAGEEADD